MDKKRMRRRVFEIIVAFLLLTALSFSGRYFGKAEQAGRTPHGPFVVGIVSLAVLSGRESKNGWSARPETSSRGTGVKTE